MSNTISYNKLFTMGGGSEKEITSTVQDVLNTILAIPPVVARGSMMDHLIRLEGKDESAKLVWTEDVLRGIAATDEFHLRQIKTYMEKRMEEQQRTF